MRPQSAKYPGVQGLVASSYQGSEIDNGRGMPEYCPPLTFVVA